MAENVDYLSALLQDNTIDTGKKTSAEYLETLKQKLTALGAKPGTPAYENAFVSYLSIRGGNQGTFGNKDFQFSDTPAKALDYLKTGLTPAQVKELGVDPAGFGGFGKQEAFVPGQTIQNPKTFEILNIADLDTIPDWFNPQSLPGFAEAGIKPGAKVTPQMRAKITELMGGQSASNAATGVTGTTATGYNPATGTFTASDGKPFTDAQAYATYQASLNKSASDKAILDANTKAAAETAQANRQSAYDLLLQQFSQYGLSSLVEPLKELITSNVSPSEFGLRLQQTDAYKKRFAANQERINKGLRALTPAEYIGLEDQYQNIMRNYGLPASYYAKDSMGTQEGFNKFLANDVSAAELEDRIATAQKRVLNTNPEVLQALKQFYPDLNNADILAYTLDPNKALEEIKRKVTAAEIGGAALAQGLQAQGGTAEALAGYGITKAQAQQGYQTIGEFLPTAEKLGDIYSKQGLGAYDQSTAEREIFGTQGGAQAAQKRRKLAQLEQATFGGQAGTSQGALDRGRQGSF